MFGVNTQNKHVHHNNEIPSMPHIFGPGMWIAYHVLGYNSQDYTDHVYYCKIVRRLNSGIPCHTCREHAKEFTKLNPPESAIVEGDPKCMFRWSCALHNNANLLTGKNIVDWNIMYEKYSTNSPQCTGQCDVEIPTKPGIKPSTKPNQTLINRLTDNTLKIRNNSPKVIVDDSEVDRHVSRNYNHKMYIKNSKKL